MAKCVCVYVCLRERERERERDRECVVMEEGDEYSTSNRNSQKSFYLKKNSSAVVFKKVINLGFAKKRYSFTAR